MHFGNIVTGIDAAEILCKRILSVSSKEPEVLHLLGCIHKDLGHFGKRRSLSWLLLDWMIVIQLHARSWQNIWSCGQYGRAIEILKVSLSRNQQIPETWFVFGECLYSAGKDDKAVMAYRNVLQLDPCFVHAYNNLGVILKEKGSLLSRLIATGKPLSLSRILLTHILIWRIC